MSSSTTLNTHLASAAATFPLILISSVTTCFFVTVEELDGDGEGFKQRFWSQKCVSDNFECFGLSECCWSF